MGTGTYYVAVTSTGNTNFDPTIAEHGFRRHDAGRLPAAADVHATVCHAASRTLPERRSTATATAPRADATTSGSASPAPAQTIFVDKARPPAPPEPPGRSPIRTRTISRPWPRPRPAASCALSATAAPNGLSPRSADNLSYNIGFDSLNQRLSDGSKLEVPSGVTVMIDAGADHQAARRQHRRRHPRRKGIDRSGGALQVLGTPATERSGATSARSTSRRTTTPPSAPIPARPRARWPRATGAVWCSATIPTSRPDGIFLNYVNHAA